MHLCVRHSVPLHGLVFEIVCKSVWGCVCMCVGREMKIKCFWKITQSQKFQFRLLAFNHSQEILMGRGGTEEGVQTREEKSSCEEKGWGLPPSTFPLIQDWPGVFPENSDFQCISQRLKSSDSKCQAWFRDWIFLNDKFMCLLNKICNTEKYK